MDKILILGANGFTGKHFQKYIVKKNLSEKFNFVGIDLIVEKLLSIKYIESDLSNYNKFQEILLEEKPDYIINLIGSYTSRVFQELLEINVNISHSLLEIIKNNKIEVKKILFIGSAAEYGIPEKCPIYENSPLRPVNLYGLSKSIQTQIILYYSRNYNINYNLARTFNIIGKNISSSLSIGAFRDRIINAKDGDYILTGNLDSKRDFIDINDVINAYWHILIKGKLNEIYNVCLGESYSIKEVLSILIEASGKSLNPKINPEWVKENEVLDIYGDNSKLKNDTGWYPLIDIADSLKKIL